MIIGKLYHFHAAHCLDHLPEDHPCSKMHGHTYKVEVLIDGEVDPETGMVMDFHEINEIVEPLIETLDHSTLNDHIEISTAENIAKWLFEKLRTQLPLAGVRVWETLSSFARYTYVDYDMDNRKAAEEEALKN